jgi:orotidine-5'-phosphate decarboxylase
MSTGCRLILALDVETKEEALALARPLAGNLVWVKLGLQLFTRHGPGIVDEFHALGFKVFLDLKLHDIPNTVASAIKSLKGRPCSLLTLHASGGPEMIARAREAADTALPCCQLLSVTVLTSMDQAQLTAVGVSRTPEEQVRLLGRMAIQAGSHGLVCSPLELPMLRKELGAGPTLVTPGIRYPDAAGDDQNRVMTPVQAAAAGSSFIVVGRPILKDKDPAAKTLQIRREIGEAS